MSTSAFILALVLGLALGSTAVDALLKCWRCSTDVSNGVFCDDPFDPEFISDQQRYWSYVNCSYSAGFKSVNARPVCKKLVQEVYGKRVITRSCFYEDFDDTSDRCGHETSSSYIKTVFCQTCSTDGCNGVTAFTPYVSLMLLPFVTILVKINK
ncbi:UPAR/Ly6 domain-containing protein twit [Eurosta solidaginis]|uniref:UPAR/Ly6 domain-containing protein twit n=1 Tax=Eurosta solidaginis TaxID=178769 RepID=UPI0035316E7E